MNRNTILGTLGVSLLLALGIIVSRQEASSLDSDQLNTSSYQLVTNKITVETQMSQVARGINHFGFNLLEQIQQQQPEDNLLLSPSSIAIALAMTRSGTEATTKAEMTDVLALDSLESEAINLSYQQLIETLKTADPDVNLAIANSLWGNRNISFKPQFISRVKDFYQAKVSNLDFADSQSKQVINDWVANNTNNKITEILDSTSPEDALYLINAIYFQGIWSNKFDPNQTTEKPFYRSPNSAKNLPMMNQRGDYRYYQSDRFQAVRLPYGEKEELAMYIFLPTENSSLAEFYQQLNYDNWQEWLSKMRSQEGSLTIPSFQLEYELDLQDSLSALGLQEIFNPQTGYFSPMTDTPVVVDNIKHKTYIEVKEEGTEAAGVTSIGIRITSLQPENKSFTMNVNRPFFFAIRDDITETIIFMGSAIEL